jgi:endonuclease/exonuclease/phosphatase family metal-dependent hydrolase
MRLATYNTKNLFLCGEGPEKPAKEVRALVRMISALAADIVLMQEVGSQQTLELLNNQLTWPYEFARVMVGNSDRSIHLAVLARRQGRLSSHRELPLEIGDGSLGLKLQRDILLAEFDHDLAILNVHFKSRTNRAEQGVGADDIRAAECRALCELARRYQTANPDRLIAIGGDFNDRPSSDALACLQELEFTDPLSEQLRLAGRHPSTFWSKRRMRIDRLLVSNAHLSRVIDTRIHATRMAQVASDHYPVTVDLE